MADRWTVLCEHTDGRCYRMGDANETCWTKETAERIALHMGAHESGVFTAELMPPVETPAKKSKRAKGYDWRQGDHAHVVAGPHTGAEGQVDFLDWPRERALVDFGEGRKGGLTWVPLKDLRPPAGGSLWSIPNRR